MQHLTKLFLLTLIDLLSLECLLNRSDGRIRGASHETNEGRYSNFRILSFTLENFVQHSLIRIAMHAPNYNESGALLEIQS